MIEVNNNSFNEEVLESNKKVLVDFNANWCGPCKMLKPVLEEISNSRDDIKIVSVKVDEEDELSEKYNVSSIPCLVLFDKGNEIKRNVGLISKDEIESLIGEE